MSVITVTGPMGAGAPQLSEELSRMTGMSIVDRVVLDEAARRLGTSADEVEARIEHPPGLWERMARTLERAMERSAGAAGDSETGFEVVLGQEYRQFSGPSSPADAALREAAEAAIREIAGADNVIFSGRAAHMALANHPTAVHVATASSYERRLKRVAERQALGAAEAERFVRENDRARADYYKRLYDVSPDEHLLFHIVVNSDLLDAHENAEIVLAVASEITARSTPRLHEQPND